MTSCAKHTRHSDEAETLKGIYDLVRASATCTSGLDVPIDVVSHPDSTSWKSLHTSLLTSLLMPCSNACNRLIMDDNSTIVFQLRTRYSKEWLTDLKAWVVWVICPMESVPLAMEGTMRMSGK